MSDKPNARAKSRRNRRILIAAVAIFLVLISILAYISSLHQPAKSNGNPVAVRPSSTYFRISDVAGTYRSTSTNVTNDNPPTGVRINLFSFTFTPVKGDATNVRIFVAGMDDPQQHSYEGTTIPNGTATNVGDITPPYSLLAQRQSDGNYTLSVRITAKEADGNVVLRFQLGKTLYPG
jgi:hypothetical protein